MSDPEQFPVFHCSIQGDEFRLTLDIGTRKNGDSCLCENASIRIEEVIGC
jgi:hypothetical protein